ncbi:MAG: hypothetical protein CIT03_03165 [Methanobacterium sp.]|nr:MAG: hypothetical protein CIT03_03165 [Methanobacterium sp.]
MDPAHDKSAHIYLLWSKGGLKPYPPAQKNLLIHLLFWLYYFLDVKLIGKKLKFCFKCKIQAFLVK